MRPLNSPSDCRPSHVFKETFDSLEPAIPLINSSLSSGCIPAAFKHAVVQPLIKKKNLDPAVFSNYRPISKLPFLSKVLEKMFLSKFCHF